ncbi:MAG TPA: hypothetical protein VD978_12420 [Azospirillum sp.]|nr:hypothetical protein [Azospirillum sp.]
MMPAYLAALELERRKAEESAEFSRQLSLYAEEIAYWQDPETGTAPQAEPDWATNY